MSMDRISGLVTATGIAAVEALAVVSAASPTELNSRAGTIGQKCLVYQVAAAADTATLYAWEAANSGGANAPYVMAASGSGFWYAVAGRYAPALTLSGALVVGGLATLQGNATVAGTLGVTGLSTLTAGLTTPAQITSTIVTGTAPLVIASTTVVGNLNVSQLLGATWAAPGTIGSGTPSTGAFTTISATGAITSTLATGTAPFTVASTTVVGNLNVSQLLGGTWAIPGTIGSTTKNTGAFTTLTANGATTLTAGTASTTTGTGTLVITGGLGVSGALYIGSTLGINNILKHSSLDTDRIQIYGSNNTTSAAALTFFGKTHATNANEIYLDGAKVGLRSTVGTNWLSVDGTTMIGALATTLTVGTASSSTTTGTLVVTGGVGVSGAAFIGGVVNVAGGTAGNTIIGVTSGYSVVSLNGTLAIPGFVGMFGGATGDGHLYLNALTSYSVNLRVNNADVLIADAATATISPSTASSSMTTGALVVTGGCGISGALNAASIKFANAGSTLSNYEEGTFTPVIAGSTTAGTQTYSLQYGHYVRVGRLVYVIIDVALSALGGTIAGNVLITGLPFTSSNTSGNNSGLNIGLMTNTTLTAAKVIWTARVAQNSASITMEEIASAAAKTSLPVGNLTATSQMRFEGFYEI